MKWFEGTPIVLQTTLTPREVYVRLRDAVPGRWAIFASRMEYPVRGSVRKDECVLELRTLYNNGFSRLLRLRFVEIPTGTKLIGAFQQRTSTILFEILWFGFLGIFNLVWLGGWIQTAIHRWYGTPSPIFEEGSSLWAFQPSAMMLMGYAMLRFGLWLSRRNEPKVLDFIQICLAAQPVLIQRRSEALPTNETLLNGEVLIRPRHETTNP